MARRVIVDPAGTEVRLGVEIGRGGEGKVYSVAGAPDIVAKLYTSLPTPFKVAKLAAMAKLANTEITSVAAWPISILRDQLTDAVVGIVMPRVSGYVELHHLYSPMQRRDEFPTADWEFLIWTARNVASAFSTVHSQGHVIGDVNQGNVVVAHDSRVRLIDCDSFQVRSDGRWFPCEVGVGHFTPPELQGKSFDGVVRTQNHDLFGLAVLIFHLLFLGRHPFMGVYSGREMSLEEAIAKYKFAFGSNAAAEHMSPPPFSLPLIDASAGVATLFERAFSPEAASTVTRPTALDWITRLEGLRKELRSCDAVRGHRYLQSLDNCPWCAIERDGGPEYFIGTLVAAMGGVFDINRIWKEILEIVPPEATLPSAAPTVAQVIATPIPRMQRVKAAGANGALVLTIGAAVLAVLSQSGALAAMVGVFAFLWLALKRTNTLPAEKKRRQAALAAANAAYVSVSEKLKTEITQGKQAFERQLASLDVMHSEYASLEVNKQRELAKLQTAREQHQFQRHLQRQYISAARIEGVGAGRLAALRSFGIETAADVVAHKVMRVPGIGDRIGSNIMAWRRQCERTFTFNRREGVDPSERQRVELTFGRRRHELESALRGGAHNLRRLAAHVDKRRQGAIPEMTRLATSVASAKADVAVA